MRFAALDEVHFEIDGRLDHDENDERPDRLPERERHESARDDRDVQGHDSAIRHRHELAQIELLVLAGADVVLKERDHVAHD